MIASRLAHVMFSVPVLDRSPADAVRAPQAEHALSERHARRYFNAAQATLAGVVVRQGAAVVLSSLSRALRRRLGSLGRPSGASKVD